MPHRGTDVVDLATKLGGIELKNPVLVASGTFGAGREASAFVDLSKLGGVIVKSMTVTPWKGKPTPRMCETPSGMLNAIGLQNPGIQAILKKYPAMWENWAVPAIVNISAESVADYAEMAAILDEQPAIAGIEINVSCPNVARGGYCFGWDPEMSAEVTRAVRSVTTLPLIVKLSPGATDIVAVAAAVEDAGADAVSLINTLVGMAIDVRHRKPLLANQTGGLSGPAIKPIAVRMVYQVAAAVRVPVIGMGGIMGLNDALEFFLAGATAVQVGTGIFVDPGLPIRLIEDLGRWLDHEGFSSIDQIVGIANDGFHLGAPDVLTAWEAAGV